MNLSEAWDGREKHLSRRDFLRQAALLPGALAAATAAALAGASADALAAALAGARRPPPSHGEPAGVFLPPPPESLPRPAMLGRVTRAGMKAHPQPDPDSPASVRLARDALITLSEMVISPHGPRHNPRWYRMAQGYVHSGAVQRVEKWQYNPVLAEVPQAGQPGEVTVPYTQSYFRAKDGAWRPRYRLYFGSLHWITGVALDEQGGAWYTLTDDWLGLESTVSAAHLRPLPESEYSPLAAEVPAEEKRIEVSLKAQALTAYQGKQAVLEARVSTGRRWMETPAGEFAIQRKYLSRHMGDGALSDAYDSELPGVPWVAFFHSNGSALHGTYWHDDFGAPNSHGCVNLPVADARWLFRWSTPVFPPPAARRSGWKVRGAGTRVVIGE